MLSRLGRRRRSARTCASGVREKRQPPKASESPSFTFATASSSVVSFSPADFGFDSRR